SPRPAATGARGGPAERHRAKQSSAGRVVAPVDSLRPTATTRRLQFRASKRLAPLMALLALVAVPTVVDAATTASRPRATKPTTTTPATTTPTTATTTTPTTTTPTTTTPVVKTPTLHWNKAIRLEPTTVGGLDAVSCAVTGTSQVCVAVDQ